MVETAYYCSSCKRPIQGNSHLCVRCFFRRHKPCTACMVQRTDGTWRPRWKGRSLREVDCSVCNNERYVIVGEE